MKGGTFKIYTEDDEEVGAIYEGAEGGWCWQYTHLVTRKLMRGNAIDLPEAQRGLMTSYYEEDIKIRKAHFCAVSDMKNLHLLPLIEED